MEELTPWIPLLILALIVQLGLQAFALVDLVRREKARGPKWVWVLVIIFGELPGPIVYLLFGRGR